jgi:RNA polymerase sigma factor (sigma-70 family)
VRRRSDPLAQPQQLIRRIYAYAAYRVPNQQDAEDVTSETFERALRYRDSYDASKGAPIGWLLGIARRCVDERLARTRETASDVPEGSGGEFEEHAVERVSLASALAELGMRDRELIALRYGADLTAAQIGIRLAMSTNAVEVALHRALSRLRESLDGSDSEQLSPLAVRVSAPGPVTLLRSGPGSKGEAR